MGTHAIWWPAFAMAFPTRCAWPRMFAVRAAQMRRERIDPHAVAAFAQAAAGPSDSRAAANFNNRSELPVLFRRALAMAAQTRQGSGTVPWLAKCGYNSATHRFCACVAASAAPWAVPAGRLWQA